MLPIHYAVLKSHVPMVEMLLDSKADEIAFRATCKPKIKTRRHRKFPMNDAEKDDQALLRRQKLDACRESNKEHIFER